MFNAAKEHIQEKEWLALHNELSVQPRFKGKLAGLFRAFEPETYRAKTISKRLLYVGKATHREFDKNDEHYPYFNKRSSGFWMLAREISEVMDGNGDLPNVAWTNLCKIGRVRGNPQLTLIAKQRKLAARTLRQEIEYFDPTLIVIVSEGFADEIVYDALRVTQNEQDGFETIPNLTGGSRYTRPEIAGIPPILWVQHPERKSVEKRKEWVEAAKSLLSS